MNCIYDYPLKKLETYFLEQGEKKFKATQVFDWLYKKRVPSFALMSNLKKELIETLEHTFTMTPLKLLEVREGKDVKKFLFELEDQEKIEAVLMFHDYGNSLCVSTQVGCNMGCAFCESGRLKKVRNLKPSEMVLQFLQVEDYVQTKITHVVLMGIGEPFDNYENVMDFIDILNEPKGLELGARHITISTCGIIPKIKTFMEEKRQVNLAISLHAPNQELRSQLMQVSRAYPLDQLIEILKEYETKTHRRLTFEYILLKGVNDSLACADELSKLLKGINCYVNLIPYNETSHFEFQKTPQEQVMKFYDRLKKNGTSVTIRKEFGGNVMAACGQLRSHYKEE